MGLIGTSFLSVAVHYGYGNHFAIVLSEGNLRDALLYTMIWSSFSLLMIALAKFSVVSLLIEAQGTILSFQKWFLTFLVVISLCTTIVDLFLLWFQCDPPKRAWDWESPNDCRLSRVNYNFTIFSGAWSAFADLALTMYPVYFIYAFQMSWTKRLALGGILAMGVFSCICAIMRTCDLKDYHHTTNPTYNTVPLVLWHTAESTTILIASGLLPLWPLIKLLIEPPEVNTIRLKSISQPVEEDNRDGETTQANSNRSSAASEASAVTDATTLRNSMAATDMDGAIAVKREITIDSERRKHSHGLRPNASVRSWATLERPRWGSTSRPARSPSWARGMQS